MFFSDVQALVRVLVIGTLSYAALIVLLRLMGKRTLAKWNAFDLIVTIALGSTLATLLLTRQVAFAEGVLGLIVLIGLQYLISWSSCRSALVRRLTKSDAAFLYRDGGYVQERLLKERVTEGEVRAAVRGAGLASMNDVAAVVLETDGSVSVIQRTEAGDSSALCDVQ